MPADDHASPQEGDLKRISLLVPITVACCNFVVTLTQHGFLTALPGVGASLGESPNHLGQLVTTYLASLIISMPLASWAASRFGLRACYCSAVFLFGVSSILGGLATDIWMLTGMRVLQGCGAAFMGTLGQVVILGSYPRNRTMTVNSYLSLAQQTAQIIAPLVGGGLTTYLSWRWLFFVNVPIALVGALLAFFLFPSNRSESRVPLDRTGFLLFSIGIAVLIFSLGALRGGGHSVWFAIGGMAVGIFVLACVVFYSLRTAEPLLDVKLFRLRTFRASVVTGGGFDTSALASVAFLLPLTFQVGFGMTAVESGALTFIAAVGSIIVRIMMPSIIRRFGFRRVLVCNTPILAAVIASFWLLNVETPWWIVVAQIFLFGGFRSAQWFSTNNLAYAQIELDQLRKFSALYYIADQLSVALGIGLASALVALLATSGQHATSAEIQFVFIIEGLITIAAWRAYLGLKPDDGANVSGHAGKPTK